MLDLLIKGGKVVDGTGRPWAGLEVGITGDTITGLAPRLSSPARTTIDANGLVVAPGFIDMHSHSDLGLFSDPLAEQKIHKGITTELLGQDGLGVAPIAADAQEQWAGHLAGLLGRLGTAWPWESFGEYLSALDRRTSINAVSLVSHGAVRLAVMGMDARAASDAELAAMEEQVAEAMRAGAVGVSTGLIYTPCVYAEPRELVALCRAASEYGGFLVVHVRNEGEGWRAALDEVFEVGEQAGVPVHISHLKVAGKRNWGKAADVLAKIDAARTARLDVTFDQYPYEAGSTMLSALLPAWVSGAAHTGNVPAILADESLRRRILADMSGSTPGQQPVILSLVSFDDIMLSSVGSETNRQYEGKRLTEIARLRGQEPAEAVLDLLMEEDMQASIVAFSMCEDDIRQIMTHEAQMFGTDGLLGSRPHPRVYGSFPKVLGRYVRESGLLGLEDAIRRMTSFPAQRLGLADRGFIREGFKADLTIFDPDCVIDTATYDDPCRFPEGIEYVIVNGEVTLAKGQHLGTKAGQAPRCAPARENRYER